jgi:hypothetical protein
LSSTIESLRQEIKRLKSDLQEKVKVSLKSSFAEFFLKFPEVKTVYWTQYTPSYNDGDPCVFTLGDLYFSPAELDGHPEDYDGDEADAPYASFGGDKRVSAELRTEMKALESFLYDNADMLEPLYGNNVAITVTRERVTLDEYDCGY